MLQDIGIHIDGKQVVTSLNTPGKRATKFFRAQPLNTASAMPVTIGSERLSGFVDEVMIWDRALDAGEIARLYKATGGQKLDPALEASLMSNALPAEGKPAAGKPPAGTDNAPKTGKVDFSDWLKTVRFRGNRKNEMFVDGDVLRQMGPKGKLIKKFQHRITGIEADEQVIHWMYSNKRASLTVSPDWKSAIWMKSDGSKHRLTVVPRK